MEADNREGRWLWCGRMEKEESRMIPRFQALAIGLRMEVGEAAGGTGLEGRCVELRLGFVKFEIGRDTK